MTSPLPDTWFTRDLPVLRAIARLVDAPEHGGSPYLLGAVVPAGLGPGPGTPGQHNGYLDLLYNATARAAWISEKVEDINLLGADGINFVRVVNEARNPAAES